MSVRKTLAASVQAKKGRLYAVIQFRENGKSKSVWRTLDLPEGTAKSKVNKKLREVVNKFEEDLAEREKKKDTPDCDITIFSYMTEWLEKTRQNIQISTYESYHGMIYGKIQRYFEKHRDITVGNMKPKDIENFYDYLYAGGVCSNTVIHYHAILHKAFKQAFKDELITANPFDRIDRPKKNKFHGENYSEEELLTLLNVSKSELIYSAIMLAGGLGLRRSEALGIRWSRIDWEKKTVLLDTKMVEYKENGVVTVKPVEEMKNKSSRRTLPIPEPIIEMLQEELAKQNLYKKMFRNSYNHENDDYVCVNQLGEFIKPSYVSNRFNEILKKYGLRHIRFHDLRHTFASILIGKDVPLINVSNFLGHSDISTTANIYAHLDKASKQASADIITDILTGKDKH